MELLTRLPYPGNIRQLKNIVDSSVLIAGKKVITTDDILPNIEASDMNLRSAGTLSGMTIDEMERQTILKAIDDTGGNVTQMALKLGITRQSLYRRLKKYGIEL